MYSTKFFPFQIPYLAIILVEPELIDRDTYHKTNCDGENCNGQLQKITSAGLRKEAIEQQPPRHLVLECDNGHEGEAHLDNEVMFDATDQIAKVCNNVPIHVICGEINDSVCVHAFSLRVCNGLISNDVKIALLTSLTC